MRPGVRPPPKEKAPVSTDDNTTYRHITGGIGPDDIDVGTEVGAEVDLDDDGTDEDDLDDVRPVDAYSDEDDELDDDDLDEDDPDDEDGPGDDDELDDEDDPDDDDPDDDEDDPEGTEGPTAHLEPPTFAALGVRGDIVDSLQRVGITHAFPIQTMTLPVALSGHDIIGQAKTGTGKTLGFGIPLLQQVTGPGEDGWDSLETPANPRRWSSYPPVSWPSRWPVTSTGRRNSPRPGY